MSTPKKSSKKSKLVVDDHELLEHSDHSLIPLAAMAVHAILEAQYQEDQPLNPSIMPVPDIADKIRSLVPPYLAARTK
jgi:hypothetical protein